MSSTFSRIARIVNISFHKSRLLHFGGCVQGLREKGIQRRYESGACLALEGKHLNACQTGLLDYV